MKATGSSRCWLHRSLARWSQTLMVFNAEYGREHGMGKAFVGHLRSSGLARHFRPGHRVVGIRGRAAGRTFLLLFFILICGVVLLTYLGKRYLVRKLGGVTGDAIGAMSELNEVLVTLLFVIFSSGT